MKISETTLPFLEEDCIRIFGKDEGTAVFRQAEEQYQELLRNVDCQDHESILDHLQRKLFPPLAYYQVLRARGVTQGNALAYVRQETQKAANIKREEMKKLARLPFAYAIYRMGVKRHMKKNFPNEGWQTEWVQCNSQEIHFNLHRCLYWDMTNKYECPELCCVYCENDDISFSGLMPKIRFERAGTLGTGAACCDFHFMKG